MLRCSTCYKNSATKCSKCSRPFCSKQCFEFALKITGHTDACKINVEKERSWITFNQFSEENNVENIKMPSNLSYPINTENLNMWRTKNTYHSSPDKQFAIDKFTKTLAENLTYVSFDEYYRRLINVAEGIKDKIKKVNPTNVIFYIFGKYNKSNTWVALLSWRTVKMVVTHVVGSKRELKKLTAKLDNIFVIYPDDMSYSGNQLSLAIRDIIDDESVLLIAPLITDIGSNGKTRLEREINSERKVLHIDSNIITREDLHDIIAKKYSETDVNEIWDAVRSKPYNRMWQVLKTHIPIYFNHKLADLVSVPCKLIATGYVYYGKNDVGRDVFGDYLPLVQNVPESHTFYESENRKKLQPNTEMINEISTDSIIPPNFYKSLKYLMDGKQVDMSGSGVKNIIPIEQ